MKHDINSLFETLVSLDLEIHPVEKRIIKIGAIAPHADRTLLFKGRFQMDAALVALDDFCKDAAFLLGHNISTHDIPFLQSVRSDLNLYALPLIDTLFLSPLAFPKNPYHQLVKDYKIIRESINDPVADARCTFSLFEDQCSAFADMPMEITGFCGKLLTVTFPEQGYQALCR